MATSNFLQHNPTEANQENDASYAADSLRTGGVAVDDILPSPWLNKIWFQCTTMVAALGQAMANKGFTVSDAVLSTLIGQLQNLLTTADFATLVVPFSSTIILDSTKSNVFEITLTGNVTNVALSGTPVGPITIIWVQDGAGGHTVAYSAIFHGAGSPSVSVNAVSTQQFALRSDATLHPTTPVVVS